MCGIIIEILYNGDSTILKNEKVMHRINNRGPDCISKIVTDLCNGVKLIFCGAVLWMQGSEITPQPVENEYGILLYNGDIFDETWDVCDTKLIMNRLSQHENLQKIIQEIRLFKGPFSIIYYDKRSQNLLFTRDKIGRNTLLFHKTDNSITISSVLGRKHKCVEIPATNIQILDIKTGKISLYSWTSEKQEPQVMTVEDWLILLQNQQNLPDEQFFIIFEESVELIDKEDVIKYIENLAQETKCKLTLMNKLLENTTIKKTVTHITELLEKSAKIRLEKQPQRCKECLTKEDIFRCNHCAVGILFSGGLDCTILAFLADKFLPIDQSIELFNVAFKRESNGSYDVPDRITGKQSFEELKKLCPSRKWIFKEINVPREELETFQRSTIADLVYPRQTILDESLGSALWFAARGQDGIFTSSCRVLLVGSGADELFGGYTRHRNAYKRNGWAALHKELHLDWRRISFRNLARDNRVICDHGRQPRMPYLDEDFAQYVLNLKPWYKCFPSDSLGQGMGDKLMLRLVAYNLGLSEVVTFPKRALQFGSRIANKKEKGSDLSKTITELGIND